MTDTKLHIAFVSPRFSEGATVGGAETLLKQLGLRLANRGHNVTFLATCAENHFTWENSLPAGPKKVGPLTVIRFPTDEKKNPKAFYELEFDIAQGVELSAAEERTWIENSVNSQAMYEHIRREGNQYDLIIAGPYLFGVPWFAAQIFPEKTILVPCLHDEGYARLNIMRDLFESVASISYNAEPEAALAHKLYGIDPHKGSVIGMGIDAFECNGDAFIQKHNIDKPYVLYCGRREAGKGTPLLTQYLNTFCNRTGRDLLFVSTGSGPIEAPAEFQSQILDLGFVSEQEKYDAMAGAQVFIQPSTFESFGIVVLESFLAETPVMAHAHSNVLRWQCERSGAGLWFRHYPDFEEELLFLLDNQEVNKQMGLAGAAYVKKHYSWDAVEKRLLEEIRSVLL